MANNHVNRRLILNYKRLTLGLLQFVLANGGNVPLGRSLSLLSLGPRPDGRRGRCAGVHHGGAPGRADPRRALAVGVQTRAVLAPMGGAEHLPSEGFLFMPDSYWSSSAASLSDCHSAEASRGAPHGCSP